MEQLVCFGHSVHCEVAQWHPAFSRFSTLQYYRAPEGGTEAKQHKIPCNAFLCIFVKFIVMTIKIGFMVALN